MICNIIDRRKRKYRWKAITAIIEPTVRDNRCEDSDHSALLTHHANVMYDEREECSLEEAVAWASGINAPLTLYLYDLGDGISEAHPPSP